MSVNRYNSTTGELEIISGGTLYADAPVGTIQAYGGTTAPSGWFLCQGQAVSRITYAELFAVIGTAFGTGDGSTTFNIPDLRETVPIGIGENGTATIAEHDIYTLGEFKDDQLKDHYHGIKTNGVSDQYTINPSRPEANTSGVKGWGNPWGTQFNPATVTHGKQLGVNYIIKAKHTPIPADFSDSIIGYLGQETNYNLYPWEHQKTAEGVDVNEDIVIEQDSWYSIDYTLTSVSDSFQSFTFRDFDSQGNVHTIMRAYYDKSGTFRQTFLIPLKAGIYRYSHGGIGTLSVYMNSRDFA